MSRIGRAPIPVPPKVQVTWTEDNLVTVKGPKGQLRS
ncbi:MAG: 50S ribosomal protein L6, partial [Firmicutes bacterium]|nr:50S ribosomal protein L6 [Bacillota bacterium]